MDRQENNVLEFPVHQVKVRRKPANEPSRSAVRRTYTVASLFSVVVLVVALNQRLLPAPSANQSRGIASIGSVSGENDRAYQRELTKQLSEKPISSLSTRGVKPSDLEQLIFGTLSGSYLIEFNDERKLTAIKLGDNRRAREIGDEEEFIRQLKDFLPVEFSHIEKVPSSAGGHSYVLVDGDRSKVGMIGLELGPSRGLLALSFVAGAAMVKNSDPGF